MVSSAESLAVSFLSAVCLQQYYSYNEWRSCIQLAGKLADLTIPGFSKVQSCVYVHVIIIINNVVITCSLVASKRIVH